MATTPTLTFCDRLVTIVSAAWNPQAPNAIARAYQFRQDVSALQGRKVYAMPTDYGYEPATRGEKRIDHRVTWVVVERYAESGLPPDSWTDARVDFVYEKLVDGLWYGEDGPLLFSGRSLVTRRADVSVLDLAKFTETPAVFFSIVEQEFEELQAF